MHYEWQHDGFERLIWFFATASLQKRRWNWYWVFQGIFGGWFTLGRDRMNGPCKEWSIYRQSGYSWQVALQQSLLPLCLILKNNIDKYCEYNQILAQMGLREKKDLDFNMAAVWSEAEGCHEGKNERIQYNSQAKKNPAGANSLRAARSEAPGCHTFMQPCR